MKRPECAPPTRHSRQPHPRHSPRSTRTPIIRSTPAVTRPHRHSPPLPTLTRPLPLGWPTPNNPSKAGTTRGSFRLLHPPPIDLDSPPLLAPLPSLPISRYRPSRI